MIRAILFDFYGVFIPDTYNEWLRYNGQTRDGVFADLINKLDKAEINDSEFLNGLSVKLGRQVTKKELDNMAGQLDEDMIEFTRLLKKKYKTCLLSNASTELRAKLENLGITDLFNDIIISSEVGHTKPDDEIFKIATKRLGVDAHEILFIDDNPIYASAAKQNGLVSITYTSLPNLQRALGLQHII